MRPCIYPWWPLRFRYKGTLGKWRPCGRKVVIHSLVITDRINSIQTSFRLLAMTGPWQPDSFFATPSIYVFNGPTKVFPLRIVETLWLSLIRDLLKLNFRFFFKWRLLHIFYTKIEVLVSYNLCRYNLQFSVPRIKNSFDKTLNLTKSGLSWHKDS